MHFEEGTSDGSGNTGGEYSCGCSPFDCSDGSGNAGGEYSSGYSPFDCSVVQPSRENALLLMNSSAPTAQITIKGFEVSPALRKCILCDDSLVLGVRAVKLEGNRPFRSVDYSKITSSGGDTL